MADRGPGSPSRTQCCPSSSRARSPPRRRVRVRRRARPARRTWRPRRVSCGPQQPGRRLRRRASRQGSGAGAGGGAMSRGACPEHRRAGCGPPWPGGPAPTGTMGPALGHSDDIRPPRTDPDRPAPHLESVAGSGRLRDRRPHRRPGTPGPTAPRWPRRTATPRSTRMRLRPSRTSGRSRRRSGAGARSSPDSGRCR